MKFNSEGMSDRFMTQDGLQRIKSGSQDLDGRAELQMKNDLDKAIFSHLNEYEYDEIKLSCHCFFICD